MKVIVITGPTGIGKTEISIQVAKRLNGIIINADASQFKKDLNIGTAKINKEERLKVKHEMLDFLDIDKKFSIYNYQKKVRPLIKECFKKQIFPILVGGSGLYIKSTLFDYKLTAESRDHDFEKKYLGFSNQELYDILTKLDKLSSERIHPNNRRRVLRALEISEGENKQNQRKNEPKILYETIFINLTTDRANLYTRINQRFEKMISNGWIEEVKTLKEKKVKFNNITEIGYKELNDYLDGNLNYDDCANIIKQKTRNYAKRQITWIKNQFACENIEVNYDDLEETVLKIINIIKK